MFLRKSAHFVPVSPHNGKAFGTYSECCGSSAGNILKHTKIPTNTFTPVGIEIKKKFIVIHENFEKKIEAIFCSSSLHTGKSLNVMANFLNSS